MYVYAAIGVHDIPAFTDWVDSHPNVMQPLNDDILLLGWTGVNCFWDVGVKMTELSEKLRDHDRDSNTDSESAKPASKKKKTKFTKDVLKAAKSATKQYNNISDYFPLFICTTC